ncbi:nucleotidyltransferase family protein [Propionibacteriaceae bacterium Y1923]|uniref:nucleotidyltransferase family protein n=1 Tax=Aestuariimicrobium sp. Y1814 TaxID=3418742 RepID=UPI003C19FE37
MRAPTVPVHLLTHLMHAFLQRVADDHGIDILHIKGPAVHPDLWHHDEAGPVPRRSTDADVLVRPVDAERFLAHLVAAGCEQRSRFTTGSPFEHAANIWSDHLGHADIHLFMPGIEADPELAFASLWERRDHERIAHQGCATPSVDDQRLVLLLHAGRSGGVNNADKRRVWDEADDVVRERVRRRAAELDATVGLAAALGELDQYRDHPSYRLWQQFSTPGSHTRTDEWVARWEAARTPRQKLSVLVRATRVNTDRMRLDLGREPTRAEVRAATRERYRLALAEVRDRFGKDRRS